MRALLIGWIAALSVATLLVVAAPAMDTPRSDTDKLAPEVEAALGALPPRGKTTVVVRLQAQADINAIHAADTPTRATKVIRALRAEAGARAPEIDALLDDGARQGKVSGRTQFWVFNGFSITATPDIVRALAARPEVASITPDAAPIAPTEAVPEWSVAAVGSPSLWNLGYTGQGVVVASLDTGVDVSHPDLAGRWRAGTNSWFDPYGQHPSTPVDLDGHGTGTMGIMVGGSAGGTSVGVAPGAKWIAARVFNDSGSSTTTAIHQAFQWLLDPDGDPTTDDAPDVVNNSWSYTSSGCNLEFQPDLQALRAAGILPVFAAGNFGPGASTDSSPANNPEALAVGAVDAAGTITSFSSRGPSSCGGAARVFPQIVAPGAGVRTTDVGGLYQLLTGTSMSAPHVAGALALLLSAHPNLLPEQQETALEQGAADLGPVGPDETYGFGSLSVLGALGIAGATPDFSLAASPPTVSTVAGGSAAATVTVSALGGFSGDVSLSLGGLTPSQATWSLSPTSVVGGSGASGLSIATSSTLSPGIYPIAITGSAGGLAHEVSLSLEVTAPPDFSLAVSPPSVTTVAGGSVAATATVSALAGFSGNVALSLSGLNPAQATWSFAPSSVVGGSGASALSIGTAAALAPGTYPITVASTSGSLARDAHFLLVVTPKVGGGGGGGTPPPPPTVVAPVETVTAPLIMPVTAPKPFVFSTKGNSNPVGVIGAARDAAIYRWSGTGFKRASDLARQPYNLPGSAGVDGLSRTSGGRFYLSFDRAVVVPGIGEVADEDVAYWNGRRWELFLDGSKHGLAASGVDAISVRGGALYFSTAGARTPPGVAGKGTSTDVYRWQGGRFARVFDASKHGVAGGSNVDGFVRVDVKRFYFSFAAGTTRLPGIGVVQDEDIVYYDSGSWSLYFDGTAHGLTRDSLDIDAFDVS